MTVSATTRRASYAGDGSTVIFAVPFKFLADAHLNVILTDALGVETAEAPSSVSGAGEASGGSVTLGSAPAVGVTVTILGMAPLEQQTDLAISDGMPADVIETAVDLLTIQNQEQADQISRAIKLPVSYSGDELQFPAPVANEVPYYDGNGKLVMSTVGFSTLMGTVQNLITLAQETGEAHTHTLASITDAGGWAKKDPKSETAKTAGYTVLAADDGKLIPFDATSGALTASLPAVATAGNGFLIAIKKIDVSANAVTIDADGSELIDGAATLVLSSQYEYAVLRCDGAAWHVLAGGASGLTAATKAEQEAATATDKSVTPENQKHNPSAAKAWANLNGTGTIALRGSFNISGVIDNGTGRTTFNYTNPMADANSAKSGMGSVPNSAGGGVGVGTSDSSPSATSLSLTSANNAGGAQDSLYVDFVIHGKLA